MRWTYVISNRNGEVFVFRRLYEKELQKINQTEFQSLKRLKVKLNLKTKDDKLYVKWKSCDHFFNSCINKKY